MQLTWILYILYVIFAIVFVVMMAIFLRPYETTFVTNENTLQNAYDLGDGSLSVEFAVKPFAIVAEQVGIIYNAVTFSNSGNMLESDINRSVANTFMFSNPAKVTSLQIIADYMSKTSGRARRVVLYNMETQENLIDFEVGLDDPVIDGFYTHALKPQDQVELEVNVVYVLVSAIQSRDLYSRNLQFVQPVPNLTLIASAQLPSSGPVIPPPESFQPSPNNMQFASFQFTASNLTQNVFQVDSRSQNPSFPLNYVYNLNVQVDKTQVFLEPGICVNDAQTSNMINNTVGNLTIVPNLVGVPNGLDQGSLEPNQWYAVFLITSPTNGLPPAGLLSKNRQMPSVLPVSYELSKRVGWARSDDLGIGFLETKQQGNGTRRLNFYTVPYPILFDSIISASELNSGSGSVHDIQLSFASPTSTSCVLIFVIQNLNNTAAIDINVRAFGSVQFDDTFTAYANPEDITRLTFQIPVTDIYFPHRLTFSLKAIGFAVNDIVCQLLIESYFEDI